LPPRRATAVELEPVGVLERDDSGGLLEQGTAALDRRAALSAGTHGLGGGLVIELLGSLL
jgi:hypothetical protein